MRCVSAWGSGCLWGGLALVLAAGVAHANGRPPLTNGIYFKPGDPHSIYLRTTFGLLISHDDGCTVSWLCENNIGYGSTFDPKYAIAADGTIFATTYTGLEISRDGGCSFSAYDASAWIDALDIGPSGEVWIGTASGGATNDVLHSTDNGMTFESAGLTTPVAFFKSLKVAPSNPQRIYVTSNQNTETLSDGGHGPPTVHLYRSDDDGLHWTPEPLANVTLSPTPLVLVAAVDPIDADIVYLVSSGANPPTGDLLYRSTDGGQTFTQVLAPPNSIHDVVIRDGLNVVVATSVETMNGEIGGPAFAASDGVTFSQLANAPQLDCLGKSPDGTLIGCGANWMPDYKALAKSSDGGATWTGVWRFVNLYGPLACPSGTAEHDVCDIGQWTVLQQQFAAVGPACGVDRSEGPQVDGPPSVAPKKSGCCDAGGAGSASLLWAFAIAASVLRRRR